MPTALARVATVHGSAGSFCISRSARPMTGSALARNHAGTFTPSDAKAARNAVTSRRSRRRSSTTCCPGSSFTISVARSGTTGPSRLLRAQHDDRRERVEQPTTDLTVGQIGAHEHHVAAVGAVAPGAHTEVHGVDQALPVERAAVPARLDHDGRLDVGTVRDDVRFRAPHDHDVTGRQLDRIAPRAVHEPRRAVRDRDDCERRVVLDPHGPGRLEHHLHQEGGPGPGPVEERGERIHAGIVDEKRWIERSSYGKSARTTA